MPKRKSRIDDDVCCLCGLPYERIGNNPAPLAMDGRCCDACNEVVIGARIDEAGVFAELTRIQDALIWAMGDTGKMAMAAMCAAHGPDLLTMRNEERAQLNALIEAERAKL